MLRNFEKKAFGGYVKANYLLLDRNAGRGDRV